MPDTLTVPAPTQTTIATDGPVMLDAERLDCYRVAVQFQVLAATIIPVSNRVLRDQLERASVSIVLNIAEGSGRRSRRDKARFYAMARGSAMECAAIVNIAFVRGLAPYLDCRRGRSLLIRTVQMLTKLQASLGARFE
jgi:four helix bundle protein